jgi:hypothetical protein
MLAFWFLCLRALPWLGAFSGNRTACICVCVQARTTKATHLKSRAGRSLSTQHAFILGYEIRQFLRKLRVVLGGLDEVPQFLGHQIFQRVAKSKMLLYALRGFALFNPSAMKFHS